MLNLLNLKSFFKELEPFRECPRDGQAPSAASFGPASVITGQQTHGKCVTFMAWRVKRRFLKKTTVRRAKWISPSSAMFYSVSASGSCGRAVPLMLAVKTGEGLKVSTRLGVIGTSTPVLGLRPIRSRLQRTEKSPNERSLTLSPRTKASEISSSAISKISRACARERTGLEL
jgi:hypothetical protein